MSKLLNSNQVLQLLRLGIEHKEYMHTTKLTESNIKSLCSRFYLADPQIFLALIQPE